jgi:hypothetical protein
MSILPKRWRWRVVRRVGNHVHDHTVPQRKRPQSTFSPPCKPGVVFNVLIRIIVLSPLERAISLLYENVWDLHFVNNYFRILWSFILVWNRGSSVSIVWLRTGRPGDRGSIPGRGKIISPPVSVSRPAVGPTQPLLQWVPLVLSPGLKRYRVVTLTTHPHVVPRLRMSRGYVSSPPKRLHGVLWDCFSFFILICLRSIDFSATVEAVHSSHSEPTFLVRCL